ncbi:radical SAM/SPASM domain-containing protein [Leadbettera azotonutricia]|uniref:Radical SAM domain protein n=1 Tax=Leadbettera azotonutricia (strain ATCC BAA-888 / DSM 13862 / ZAS-9) TaxID=545695 RepID=F5Y911_LEAAZ|nr:SPASM domain-containing protein [Leadbettera azotonutricia]AEF81684.1 radical SAM domain protein [Leadbettera azotonutricia ZAS-9]
MKQLSLLIKPASSLCNLRCKYCFYADISSMRHVRSYGIMTEKTAAKLLENLFKDVEDKDALTIAFQGGEPALAGLEWFQDFMGLADAYCENRNAAIQYAFQTNGILLDENWALFFKQHQVLVGLSIDGSLRFHDRNRVDTEGHGTWERLLRAKKLLEDYRVEYNMLCVLTNELADHADKVWRFILQEKIDFIQFIPCLENLGTAGSAIPANQRGNTLKPARFAKFYMQLFTLWRQELQTGHYVSIKFFDDTANWFLKAIPSFCGINGRCHTQYAVEADGSVYPCDFYALDSWNLGNLTESTLSQLFETERNRSFLLEERGTPSVCINCKYLQACHGGCKRMRNTMYYGENGVVCGYKMFLDKCLEALLETVQNHFPQHD